ncbi:MAG: hypothetical protein K6F84_00625 [Lachnospiraceae bacterium]|nr:hypothetical protein [Lachnospiraceae bacterium]
MGRFEVTYSIDPSAPEAGNAREQVDVLYIPELNYGALFTSICNEKNEFPYDIREITSTVVVNVPETEQ